MMYVYLCGHCDFNVTFRPVQSYLSLLHSFAIDKEIIREEKINMTLIINDITRRAQHLVQSVMETGKNR